MVSVPRILLFLWVSLAVEWQYRLQAQSSVPKSPDFEAATRHTESFRLQDGLECSVWAVEPQLQNGVAFDFDRWGRCFVAETHRYGVSVFDITQRPQWLLRDIAFRNVTDRVEFLENEFALEPDVLTRDSEQVRLVADQTGDGRADTSCVIADGFQTAADGTAAGVLVRDDSLWFGNIPNLWHFQSLHESAHSETEHRPFTSREIQRTRLAHGFGVHIGVTGHDLHGLILGPDGRLYMSFGDRGVSLTTKEGDSIHLPDTGGVLRCEPDGSRLEVYCIGLRNPQELAFDDWGRLWTVDNDTNGADPCRVLYLVPGADYGWRYNYQYMTGFGPWVQEALWQGNQDGILPSVGKVSQGPSGLAWYPGVGFGDRFKDCFLHCDFPGGVWAFSVNPKGAGFEIRHKEQVLWNAWPTDVAFGPDGALYVLDWVAGWQIAGRGRIYRLQDPMASDLEEATRVGALLAAGFADVPLETLTAHLAHPHQRIRQETQQEVVRRILKGTLAGSELSAWIQQAVLAESELGRLHTVWALGQARRTALQRNLPTHVLDPLSPLLDIDRLESALRPLLEGEPIGLRLHAAQVLAEAGSSTILQGLMGTLDHPDLAVQAQTVRILALWAAQHPIPNSSTLTEAVLACLARDTSRDRYLHQAAVHWLEQVLKNPALKISRGQELQSSNSPLVVFAKHPVSHVRSAAVQVLRIRRSPAIRQLFADPDPAISVAVGRAIHDAPIAEGLPDLALWINRVDCPEALMSRAINAAYRLGTQQHAQMLASVSQRIDVGETHRAMAIQLLGEWPKPSPLDAVNGFWRPPVTLPEPNTDTSPAPSGSDSSTVSPTPGLSPQLGQTLQQAARAGFGRVTALPRLPEDLGRSVSYEEGIAVRRNPVPARRAFLRVAAELLHPEIPDETGTVLPEKESLAVQLAVIKAAVPLAAKEVAHPLYEVLLNTNASPELRQQIVPTLAALNAYQAGLAVEFALRDADTEVQSSAIPHLDRLAGERSLDLLREYLSPVLDSPIELSEHKQQSDWGSREQRLLQAAFSALAHREEPSVLSWVSQSLRRLVENPGSIPVEVHLDILEAARAHHGRRSKQGLSAEEHAGDIDLTDLLQNYESRELDPPDDISNPVLYGGNIAQGQRIFMENLQVQCLRCHRIGTQGGTVGPSLDRIASKRNRAELLSSILEPNRAYTEGYEPGEGGLSAMPEGLGELLTDRELRDLVAYLASLK